MSLSADIIIDRIKLKEQLGRWRLLAILAVVFLAIFLVQGKTRETPLAGDYIARVVVAGLIQEDQEREDVLKSIAKNANIKAVVVYINSPGGTMVGSEQLYERIKKIAQVKPVVTVMGSVAASGGYMAAVGSHYIFAQEGSLTGSIGVYFQSVEVTDLAQKVGVTFNTFKSSPLKASPTPFEKITPLVENAVNELVKENYDIFVNIVADGRKMPRKQAEVLADGRVYTGKHAVENGLIDAIGGEDEAVLWLQKEKNIPEKLQIKELKLHKEPSILEQTFGTWMGNTVDKMHALSLHGMLAVWQPAILQ